MKYEFHNHNSFMVKVPNSTGALEIFKPKQTKVLDEFFKRYVPRQLSIKKMFNDNGNPIDTKDSRAIRASSTAKNIKTKAVIENHRKQLTFKRNTAIRKSVVGRMGHSGRKATEFSLAKIAENDIAISNHIGIGILSYNRLGSLSHLISSIRKFTDLTKTTVFVSDESTDDSVWKWLKEQKDIVAIHNPRIGIAGNSNRLLRCLDRFKYKILLNDDVEILKEGWEQFYFNAMATTGIKHFCYRQDGVYGATRPSPNSDGVITVSEKPHGAVMAIHDDAFRKVGFFDESFGIYGFEHVNYSDRISKSGLCPNGYHDMNGSNQYFKIHNDDSADDSKISHLALAKRKYSELKNSETLYVNASDKTACQSISVVIPYRDMSRNACLVSVVNCIRAQKFPVIQIVLVEQDEKQKVNVKDFPCIEYIFYKNKTKDQHFCKSMAFNMGVSKTIYPKLVLHDADMLQRMDYITKIDGLLDKFEAAHIGATVCYMDQGSTSNIIASGSINKDNISSDRIVTYYEGGSFGIRKDAYTKIGGFVEDFVGYGNEDTEFFRRMSLLTKFCNERFIDLFHLWHPRTPGWEAKHEQNKALDIRLSKENQQTVANRYNKYLREIYKL